MDVSLLRVGPAWCALSMNIATVALAGPGCGRPLDTTAAGQLLSDGRIAGAPVYCPTPLRLQSGIPWRWGDEPALRSIGAAQCVDVVREHGIVGIELIRRVDDAVAPSSIDGAYRMIVPVAGRSEIRDATFLARCGATRVTAVDVETKGDSATIAYREGPEVDKFMLNEVSACNPGAPAKASQDRKVRAFRVEGQWHLGR